MSTACTACHAALDGPVRFCPHCGAKQPEGGAAPGGMWKASERRHLAIMFCDIVGSTPLSQTLDPEDLGRLYELFQARSREAIEASNGYLAQVMGDGVMAFFGFPDLRENPVEDAIHAALALRRAVDDQSLAADLPPLRVRIGIADGPVVVGDLASHDGRPSVVGETPNLAARLQTVAPPGGIAISNAARRRVGGLFRFSAIGKATLKGFASPIEALLVEGEAPARTRYGALRRDGAVPLLGRDAELAALERAFATALTEPAAGRVALIQAEPGLGKSRLAEALADRLEGVNAVWIGGSERHGNSPLYPVLQRLQIIAGFTPDDSEATRLARLRAVVDGSVPTSDLEDTVALLAGLLDLPPPPGEAAAAIAALPASARRRRSVDALVRLTLTAAGPRGLLFVAEDAHWLDPTTLEFLAAAAREMAGRPAMMLLTTRPVPETPLGPLIACRIDLGPLSREAARAVIAAVGDNGQRPLPPEVEARIIDIAEGVPLFIEELTRAQQDGGGGGDAMPTTVQDTLLMRLGRQSRARQLAQAASAIGRRFEPDLLSVTCGLSASAVQQGLAALMEAALIRPTGDGSYEFRHALMREAAYAMMLRDTRKTLHRTIGETLRSGKVEGAEARPETIATHLGLGGLPREAAGLWREAAARALAGAAFTEAAGHLRAGIADLAAAQTPDAALELELQSMLGSCLMQLLGFAAPEAEAVFDRAETLCDSGEGSPARRFHALWGIWAVRISRGQTAAVHGLAARMKTVAAESGDPALDLLALSAQVPSAYLAGTHPRAIEAAEAVMGRYDHARDGPLALAHAVDAKSQALLWGTLAAWEAGDTALHERLDRELEAHVARQGYPFLQPYADCLRAYQRVQAGRPAEALPLAARAGDMAARQDLQFWQVGAMLWTGAAQIAMDEAAEGVPLLTQGLAAYQAIGTAMLTPYLRCMLALGHHRLGDDDKAEALVAEAYADAAARGEGCARGAMDAIASLVGVKDRTMPEVARGQG
jgi:class 3 adenylate cyclase